MGLISITGITDGTVIDASDVNTPLNTIVNELNGNLNYLNIADSGITTNKIADANITLAKLASDSVSTAKIVDEAVTFSKLLSTLFGGQVQAATNTGTAGGTMNYIDLKGIKVLWGKTNDTGAYANGTTITKTIIYPTSFFSTAPTLLVTQVPQTSSIQFPYQQTGGTASQVTVAAFNSSGANASIAWHYLAIGS